MVATVAQIGFITQEFRSVKNGPDATVVTKYGDAARRNTEPVETFFESGADAQSICDERKNLLSADRRRFLQSITGEATGLALAYTSGSPSATVIDDERLANMSVLISEITIDFGAERTNIESWG